MRISKSVWLIALLPCFLGLHSAFGESSLLSDKFDHEFHMNKVFKPQDFQCTVCHNFALDKETGQLKPNENFTQSAFRIPLKQICHQCHQSADPKYAAAPKACITCHATPSKLSTIKPLNHNNVVWRNTHATDARVAADSCLNCHTTSQCVKCHSERNDVIQRNHPRNFRFYHSVQARLSPQRCDACHTKSFCTNCHLGVK